MIIPFLESHNDPTRIIAMKAVVGDWRKRTCFGLKPVAPALVACKPPIHAAEEKKKQSYSFLTSILTHADDTIRLLEKENKTQGRKYQWLLGWWRRSP